MTPILTPGDCTARCAGCGANVVVPPFAGIGPWIIHSDGCPRHGETVHSAIDPHWCATLEEALGLDD